MWYALGTLSRWLVFGGLLTGIGAVVFRFFVLAHQGPGSLEPDGDAHDPARRAARIGMLAMRLLLLGALSRLAAELAVFRDPFEAVTSEFWILVRATTWGRAWVAQLGLGGLALLSFFLAARGGGRWALLGWVMAALAMTALSLTPAFSGHAAGSERWRTAAILSDGAHIMAGGAWLGTLAVLAGVAVGARRSGDPPTRARLVGWISAFSPIALGSAAVIAATGVLAAWLHVDQISSLWTSPYGRLLSLKLGLLGAVLACGAYNWKRSRGRVQASGKPGRLPGTVGIELATGVAILLVTAILVTTPMPGD